MTLPSTDTPPAVTPSESQFWEPYAQSARTLRSWFLAFGIGAPAVFITSESAAKTLEKSGNARLVVILFLAGVAFQLVLAVLFKYSMLYLFLKENDPVAKTRKAYKVFWWISEAIWFECFFDIATCLCFGIATVIVMCIFAP